MEKLKELPHQAFHHRDIPNTQYILSPYGFPVVVQDGEEETFFIRGVVAFLLMPLSYIFVTVLIYKYHKYPPFSLFSFTSPPVTPLNPFRDFQVLALCLFSSLLHNSDNILRPAVYLTPEFIYRGEFAFVVDSGFLCFLANCLFAFATFFTRNPFFIFLTSLFTSLGIFHYLFAPFSWYSLFANSSILFESIMGIVFFFYFLFLSPQKGKTKNRSLPLNMPKKQENQGASFATDLRHRSPSRI